MAHYITSFFLSVLLLKECVQAFLNVRNKRFVSRHRNAVPGPFREKISLGEHQKAADYTVAKAKAGQIFQAIHLLVLLGWTLWGGLETLDRGLRSIVENELARGFLFFMAMGSISLLLNLPQSLYSTFVIEERFGFNKTSPKTFFFDMFKGIVLGIIVGGPILLTLLWMMSSWGFAEGFAEGSAWESFWWVAAWVFLTIVQVFLIWIYPTWIAPFFNTFSPLEEGEVKERALALLARTGFVSKGLFVMDASRRSGHGNAYFTGFGKNKRIVFFDTLMTSINPEEVEAILAHELGHFKKKHILKGLIKGVCLSFVGFALLGALHQWLPFYQGHGVQTPSPYMVLALFSLLSSPYTFFITPLSARISRRYEFEADHFAAKNAKASCLISALVKLYKNNAATLTLDPLYSSFYNSHPPALARIEHLKKIHFF